MEHEDPTRLKSKPTSQEQFDVPGDSFLVKVTVWGFLIFTVLGFLLPIVSGLLWVFRGINVWTWFTGLF